jgi:hypothetical protein
VLVAFISHFNAQTIQMKQIIHNSTAIFPQEPFTLVGFEPVSSVSEADVINHCSTPPRQGNVLK